MNTFCSVLKKENEGSDGRSEWRVHHYGLDGSVERCITAAAAAAA